MAQPRDAMAHNLCLGRLLRSDLLEITVIRSPYSVLGNMVATSHMWLFTCGPIETRSNLTFSPLVTLATFEVLGGYVRLVCIILDSARREHVYCGMFYGTVLVRKEAW